MKRPPLDHRHRNQRERILRAVVRLAAELGWPRVTMRRLATALGCQPASIYEYFPSKEAILSTLAADGFDRLLARLTRDGPDPTLPALARTVWAFAQEEPQVYQAMHGMAGAAAMWGDERQEAKALFALARRAVAREAGDAMGLDLDAATDICWAMVHGTIALAMAGRIAGEPERAAALLEAGLATLAAGWRRP
jgi:AcrR family transcriptional regulator